MEIVLNLFDDFEVEVKDAYDCDTNTPSICIYDCETNELLREVVGESIPPSIDDEDFNMDAYIEHIDKLIG